MAVPLAHKLAGIEMQVGALQGSLLTGAVVRDFSYRDPWVAIEVGQASIDWQPHQLLVARVQIDQLDATNVQVTLQDEVYADNTNDNQRPVLLPISVHIENANIKTARFLPGRDSSPWLFDTLQGQVQVLEDRVRVKDLRTDAYGASAQAEGFISWHGAFPMALKARVDQPLPDKTRLLSHIEAAGDLENFKLQLLTEAPYAGDLATQWRQVEAGYDIAVQGPMEPAPLLVALDLLPAEALATGPLNVDAQGLLTASGFEASRLNITQGERRIDAVGNLRWADETLSWTATANWQNLALPPWAPALQSAKGHAEVNGTPAQGTARIDGAYQVEAQPAGQAKLVLQWQDGAVELKQGELAAGKSRLTGQGQVWPRAALAWAINSPGLGELWPAAVGSLKGQGKLSGDWLAPHIQGQLQGSKLRLSRVAMDTLDVDANLNLETDSQGKLKLRATGLSMPDVEPATLNIDVSGRRSAHEISAAVQSPQLSATLKASGGWAGGNAPWLGRLRNLDIDPQQTAEWQLETPTALELHPDKLKLERACLKQSQSRLCMQGGKLAERWQGDAQLTQLPLALLTPWLPPPLKLQGMLNGNAQIQGSAGQWQKLNITSNAQASLSRPDIEDTLELKLHGLSLVANPRQWNSELELQINEQGRISAEGVAEPQSDEWRSARLRGTLSLDVPDLRELALIAPEIEQLRGRMTGDIQAGGSLGQPSFSGRLALEKGQLDLRDYGISLTALSASITGKSDGKLDVNMQASSGGGSLQANGQITADFKQPTVRLSIKGERFLASRTDEATVYVSPDLMLKVENRQVELTGELGIPEAQLRPPEQQTSVQTVSPDQVLIKDAEPAEIKSVWKLLARIRIVLGDKVFFTGMGIQTRLGGQLDIRENPGKRTIANGEIRLIDGSYAAYGQKLAIDTGRLVFANAPVTEPALDLQASRIPKPGIMVGVRVRGLLDAPVVTLFSKPSMRQAEQLSYLILGRPLEGNEGNPTLANAAMALGLNRGDRYVKGLGETLGVDEIGVQTEPGQSVEQASLVVGKYLSPRLYVSYGAGLFETLHKLTLRYRISEHWTLTGESGTTQGADILYTIER